MILFVLLTFCFITIIMRVIPVCSSVPQTTEFWCFNSGDQRGLCTISSFCARLDLQNVLVNDVDHEQRLQTGNNLHEFSWIPLLLQQDVGDDEAIADGSDAIENIVEVEGPPAESMQDKAVPFAPTSEPQLRESDIPTRKFFFIVWSSAFCQCHKQFVRESDKCTPDIGVCSLTSPKCLLQEDTNAMQRETCYLLCVNLYLLLWWKCSVEFVFRLIWAKYSCGKCFLLIGLEFVHPVQAPERKLRFLLGFTRRSEKVLKYQIDFQDLEEVLNLAKLHEVLKK